MNFNIKSFTKKCIRVWQLLRKPSKQEFMMVAKVSAIGIFAIGLVGFVIGLFMTYILPA
jgi:protein transport protein SEC61 subunit gamma and related proteins